MSVPLVAALLLAHIHPTHLHSRGTYHPLLEDGLNSQVWRNSQEFFYEIILNDIIHNVIPVT